MIITAINDPNVAHKNVLEYVTSKGEYKTLQVVSSLLKDDEGNKDGIILSFDDITKQKSLEQSGNQAAITFIVLIAILSFWTFVFAIWNENPGIFHYSLFGTLITFSSLLVTPIAIKVFGYKISDLGLRIKGTKKYIIIDTIATMVCVLLLIVTKLIVMKYIPDFSFYCANNSFFDFSKFTILDHLKYILVVFAQEFLSRGLVYESVKRVFITSYDEKYANNVAVIVSSCYFATLHVAYGPIYMAGAFILLSIFGFIYNKQKTIFGLCIPHFILGTIIAVLGFVEY